MINYLCIIQARLSSTRFPNKVMETVGGIPMVKRVWLAAKGSKADKVIVAWPERYPDLDENNVLERFIRITEEFKPEFIIRLTADCPLLTSEDINKAIDKAKNKTYYSNHLDGKDVQVFRSWLLFCPTKEYQGPTDYQHVIADFSTKRTKYGYSSVDTREDLERVRKLCPH